MSKKQDEAAVASCQEGHGPRAGTVMSWVGRLRLEVCPSPACRAAAMRLVHARTGREPSYQSAGEVEWWERPASRLLESDLWAV